MSDSIYRQDAPDTNVGGIISRKQAIEAMGEEPMVWNDDDAFALGERNQWERDVEALRELPPVEPRKKGKWILCDNQRQEDISNGNYMYTCTNCLHSDVHSKSVVVPYCWHCGAMMTSDKTSNKR